QTTGGCDGNGCFVASEDLSGDLPRVLGRLADLAVPQADGGANETEYETRRAASVRAFEAGQSATRVTLNALLFGRTHRYGGPAPATIPTLAELEALHHRAFAPVASTLAIVGDTTLEAVRSQVESRFGGWTGSAPGPDPSQPAAPPNGPR